MLLVVWALGGLVLLILLPVVVTLAQEVVTRWKYRHIPGPPQRWLTGNLQDMLKHGMLSCIDRWAEAYGPLFGFRLMGRMFVVVADVDAVRTALYKITNHAMLANPNMHLVTNDLRSLDTNGLLLAKDEYWRWVRNAWQPAFSPASLRGYQGLMDREALALATRLEARVRLAAAAEGGAEAGAGAETEGGDCPTPQPIRGGHAEAEVLAEMSRITLAVVGSSAYGVDFSSPEFKASGRASGAGGDLSLVDACNDWFRTMSPSCRSRWAIATAFPCVLPLVQRVACALPDRVLGMHLKARHVLRDTALRLVRDWRARGPATTPSTTAAATGQPNGDKALAKATEPAAPAPAAPAVAPGSFLGLMLAARDKSTGQALTDVQLISQVQTFVLGGFETTANALTFAVYLLATNPDKAERLMREVDALLPPPSQGAELTDELLDKLVYTEAVVQEALRLFPPAHATSRESDKDISLCGFTVPAHATIFIPINHLHRSEQLWPDAKSFRPERFLPGACPAAGVSAAEVEGLAARHGSAFAPFGSGTRMCVGWRFAMQEAKTVLARLYQRLSFELPPGHPPFETVAGLTLAPKGSFRVRVLLRGK
ncbi:hypothetical protein HYH03_009509 [Edaphochlamys debaryana]|uniref:Cytochrome P450 n=1 Tax=Edaphochlamys debaryana TaxID=47281 RepID=A0A835XYV9_9CHLO|nr:hypothetical protein HYH03_009509 [Edaphochlamys debaryana]|eukprot:KAG2492269.1 hypothetical protein HYH03_009509 [Edaphochlamys debaryana]